MRDNGPVRDVEHKFPSDPSAKIISLTDPHGVIVDVNDTFVQISGFSREELIGQPQNIVRHPDMPSEVFKMLWDTIQKGQSFMGIIKNRSKDGGYYWVNATIMPIIQEGKIIGYESVRTAANSKQIARAEKYYAQMRSGKQIHRAQHCYTIYIFYLLLLAALTYALINPNILSSCILGLTGLAGIIFTHVKHRIFILRLMRLFHHHNDADINIKIYTSHKGLEGSLIYNILYNLKEVDTILTRVRETSNELAVIAETNIEEMKLSQKEALNSNDQSQQLAEEMKAIASTIAEMLNDITSRSSTVAHNSNDAANLVSEGKQVAQSTMTAIDELKGSVNDISNAIGDLASRVDDIEKASELIKGIASQTNLLALNASIEAARAGSHGRGFAVVADEVRALSLKTEKTTVQIHDLIARFKKTAKSTVELSAHGQHNAEEGANYVHATHDKLNNILNSINEILRLSSETAAIVQEHAGTAQDVNIKVQHMSNMSSQAVDNTEHNLAELRKLGNMSSELQEMLKRYSNKDRA